MFELVVLACLSGEKADICAPRLLPSPVALSRSACEATAEERTQRWSKTYPNLSIQSTKCLPRGEVAEPLKLTQVEDGIYVHEGMIGIPNADNAGDLANLGVIVGDDSVAVIDAGGTRAVGERLYLAIRALTDKPISTLIFTHMHPDHTLGGSALVEAGAEVVGHKKLDRGLRARAQNYEASLAQLIGDQGFLGSHAVFPSKGIKEHEEIDLGGRILDLRAWPTAHTDNDMTVFDRQTGTLFAGDLVFVNHTPALDGSLLGWQAVLEDFGNDIKKVVPGHGPASIVWPEGGKALQRYLLILTLDTRAAIEKGDSISRAVKQIGESERENWELFDESNPRNATAAYKELEWE